MAAFSPGQTPRYFLLLMLVCPCAGPAPRSAVAGPRATAPVHVAGELRAWHRVTLTLDGPAADEQDAENRFRNYRLAAPFTNGRRAVDVPGYFFAAGSACESGQGSRTPSLRIPPRGATRHCMILVRR